MQAELEYRLMSCIDFNPYQQRFIFSQHEQELLAELDARWSVSNTPSDVNPNTPDNFFSGDGSPERVDALCTACTLYVYSYADKFVQMASANLGLAIVLTGVASVTAVGGIIATVLVAGASFLTQITLDAMSDTDALDAVACCMRDALDGTALTIANFTASLDSCNFVPFSNEAIVQAVLQADLGELGNFLSFINSIGNSFLFAQNGISLCNCNATQTYIVTFDQLINTNFVVTADDSTLSAVIQPYDLQDSTRGNPAPSARLAYGTFSDGKEGFTTTVRIDLLADKEITDVSFQYYFFRYGASNVVNRALRLLDVSGNVVAQTQSSANDGVQNSWTLWGGALSGVGVRYIECLMALSLNPPNPTPLNTMAWIDNVTWTEILS